MTERIEQIRTAAQLVEDALRLLGTEEAQQAADEIAKWSEAGEHAAEVVVKVAKAPTPTAMAVETLTAIRLALVAAGQGWAIPFVAAATPLVMLLVSSLARGPATGASLDVVADLR